MIVAVAVAIEQDYSKLRPVTHSLADRNIARKERKDIWRDYPSGRSPQGETLRSKFRKTKEAEIYNATNR